MELLHSNVLGSGKPLVILHGFLGMSDNWKTLGRRFAETGMEVHLVDQRNHGRSFWSPSFSYEILAADLERYLDRKGIGRCLLLGHSMGGKTAMTFATAFASRVEKLLVADIGPRRYAPHHQAILGALSGLPLETVQSRGEADAWLARELPDPGIRQFLLKNLYWETPRKLGFRFNLDVLKKQGETIGAALPAQAQYPGPTLFLRGGKSDYVRDSDRDTLRAHFPQAEVKTLAGAGHWLHAEQPDAFFEIAVEFYDS